MNGLEPQAACRSLTTPLAPPSSLATQLVCRISSTKTFTSSLFNLFTIPQAPCSRSVKAAVHPTSYHQCTGKPSQAMLRALPSSRSAKPLVDTSIVREAARGVTSVSSPMNRGGKQAIRVQLRALRQHPYKQLVSLRKLLSLPPARLLVLDCPLVQRSSSRAHSSTTMTGKISNHHRRLIPSLYRNRHKQGPCLPL